MKLDHFQSCPYVPLKIKLKLKLDELDQDTKNSNRNALQYFVTAAKKLGMTDGENGIFIIPDDKHRDDTVPESTTKEPEEIPIKVMNVNYSSTSNTSMDLFQKGKEISCESNDPAKIFHDVWNDFLREDKEEDKDEALQVDSDERYFPTHKPKIMPKLSSIHIKESTSKIISPSELTNKQAKMSLERNTTNEPPLSPDDSVSSKTALIAQRIEERIIDSRSSKTSEYANHHYHHHQNSTSEIEITNKTKSHPQTEIMQQKHDIQYEDKMHSVSIPDYTPEHLRDLKHESLPNGRKFLKTHDGRMLLAQVDDREILSETFCIMRENIEVFTATEDDVKAYSTSGRRAVSLHQVGLRCYHCRFAKHENGRPVGSFPKKIKNIYQCLCNMKKKHFRSCPYVPLKIKLRLDELEMDSSGVTFYGKMSRYFVTAAKKLGMTDGENGIFMIPDDKRVDYLVSESVNSRSGRNNTDAKYSSRPDTSTDLSAKIKKPKYEYDDSMDDNDEDYEYFSTEDEDDDEALLVGSHEKLLRTPKQKQKSWTLRGKDLQKIISPSASINKRRRTSLENNAKTDHPMSEDNPVLSETAQIVQVVGEKIIDFGDYNIVQPSEMPKQSIVPCNINGEQTVSDVSTQSSISPRAPVQGNEFLNEPTCSLSNTALDRVIFLEEKVGLKQDSSMLLVQRIKHLEINILEECKRSGGSITQRIEKLETAFF